MEEGIYQAASLMMSVGPDLIAVACTSGTLIKGVGYDQKLSDRITELTKVPAITTAGAVLEAFSLLKITKVAMATPYIDEVNAKEKEFLEGNGIRVTRMKGLGYSKSGAPYPLISRPVSMIGLLYPEVAYKMAFDVDTPDAEGIFISCTNFRTIEIIAALEKNAGKPVVTSNQATWAIALRRLGIKERICGFGKLLELPE
jgi:maleate isomerase